MIYVDTHTHLYLNAFDNDRHEAVKRAIQKGVHYMLLPNIDSESVAPMHRLCEDFPEHCFPMMGLHPTSVKQNWEEELALAEKNLRKGGYCAVGEVGLDFYWDMTFRKEQETVFRKQIEFAIELQLPLVIHSRKSMDEITMIIKEMYAPGLTGIFHCFSGSPEQASRIVEMGFKLGIGGVVTFPNSKLASTIHEIGIDHLVMETDAPFISPVPYRGKRNESAYIPIIAAHVAEACGITLIDAALITSKNALQVFNSLPELKN
ncbi:MAG TPA: TatD family deoxyribonuclease [Bacteroidales bacterium]|nr:TatD family deoxyribonuclease [Bacteroidales bacterium]